jgi:phospholipid-binding lipoprotein MlaA
VKRVLLFVLFFALTSASYVFIPAGASAAGEAQIDSRYFGLEGVERPLMLAAVEESTDDSGELKDEFADEYGGVAVGTTIADPLEGFNRAMFVFNDKLYFWFMKPVAQGYGFVVPEQARVAVNRFFLNVRTPVRLVNCLLQFKLHDAGTEFWRFTVNTTLGVGGLFDPAKAWAGVDLKREDTGQTLGRYGLGPGFFINWPFFGPSSLRDSFGLIGDHGLDPVSYLTPQEPWISTPTKLYDKLNLLSLNIGVYEDLKKDSLDPYLFIRDAYHQHREKLVKE